MTLPPLPPITLPDDIQPGSACAFSQMPAAVLLTGATGYYGSYVLAELLQRTSANIHCLVRAASETEGLVRLRTNLATYGLAASSDLSRVRVVPGRIDEPRLGLDETTWARLAAEVDSIYHLAANVSFVPDFEQLRTANLGGICELLRLASAGRTKPLHLVSSYSIGNERQFQGALTVPEAPVIGRGESFMHGYPASKWAGERLADLARARGCPVTIYRAGLIWGDRRTGLCKADEIIMLNLLACQSLGIAQDMEMQLHLTPVDYCAQALVALSLQPPSACGHFHLIADPPIAWRDLVQWFGARGAPTRFVSPTEWFERFKRWVREHREWLPLYWLLSHDPTRSLWRHANMFSLRYETKHTRAALASAGLSPVPSDDALLETYRRAFATHRPVTVLS